MQTEVKVGPLTFRYLDETFAIEVSDSKDHYIGDIDPLDHKEWQLFVESANLLCKCGGGCGCSRV